MITCRASIIPFSSISLGVISAVEQGLAAADLVVHLTLSPSL